MLRTPNMNVAREFLIENGLKDADHHDDKPRKCRSGKRTGSRLAFSFISCGYHYPWQTYQGFFETALRNGGSVILDIRRRKSPAAQADMAGLAGSRGRQAADGSADRIMVRIGA